jgi:hypothetical protein
MNPVSVLTPRIAGAKAGDREPREQDDAEPECRPISLLSFLQAENIRLRQAVLELSLDTMALREELKRAVGGERVAGFRPNNSNFKKRSTNANVAWIARTDA